MHPKHVLHQMVEFHFVVAVRFSRVYADITVLIRHTEVLCNGSYNVIGMDSAKQSLEPDRDLVELDVQLFSHSSLPRIYLPTLSMIGVGLVKFCHRCWSSDRHTIYYTSTM